MIMFWSGVEGGTGVVVGGIWPLAMATTAVCVAAKSLPTAVKVRLTGAKLPRSTVGVKVAVMDAYWAMAVSVGERSEIAVKVGARRIEVVNVGVAVMAAVASSDWKVASTW